MTANSSSHKNYIRFAELQAARIFLTERPLLEGFANKSVARLRGASQNLPMSSKRLSSAKIEGPKGETITVSWMPDNRVRFTFKNCGKTTVTKLFPAKLTHIEVSYGG